jgi:hypothetical protein
MTGAQQFVGQMRADEPCAASDKNFLFHGLLFWIWFMCIKGTYVEDVAHCGWTGFEKPRSP